VSEDCYLLLFYMFLASFVSPTTPPHHTPDLTTPSTPNPQTTTTSPNEQEIAHSVDNDNDGEGVTEENGMEEEFGLIPPNEFEWDDFDIPTIGNDDPQQQGIGILFFVGC